MIATGLWRVKRTLPVEGDNLRQVAIDVDGRMGYVAHMNNKGFPTTRNNIDLGWVLGQRLTRVPLNGSDSFSTLSLDPQGRAVADAHGVAVGRDGRFLAVSGGGSHEVLIFRADKRRLPWRSASSRDLIAPELHNGDGRFRRVALGGRPTELAFAADGKTSTSPTTSPTSSRSSMPSRRPSSGDPPSGARASLRSPAAARSCPTTPSGRSTSGIAAIPATATITPTASTSTRSTTAARTSAPRTSGAARRCRRCAGSP